MRVLIFWLSSKKSKRSTNITIDDNLIINLTLNKIRIGFMDSIHNFPQDIIHQ